MRLKTRRLNVTTDASGDGTATDTLSILGLLYAIETIDGDYDNGVDGVLTCINNETAADKTIATLTNFNDDAVFYPRALVHAVADGAALTGTAGGDRAMPLLNGTLKITVAQGGNVKSGGFVIYYVPGR